MTSQWDGSQETGTRQKPTKARGTKLEKHLEEEEEETKAGLLMADSHLNNSTSVSSTTDEWLENSPSDNWDTLMLTTAGRTMLSGFGKQRLTAKGANKQQQTEC